VLLTDIFYNGIITLWPACPGMVCTAFNWFYWLKVKEGDSLLLLVIVYQQHPDAAADTACIWTKSSCN